MVFFSLNFAQEVDDETTSLSPSFAHFGSKINQLLEAFSSSCEDDAPRGEKIAKIVDQLKTLEDFLNKAIKSIETSSVSLTEEEQGQYIRFYQIRSAIRNEALHYRSYRSSSNQNEFCSYLRSGFHNTYRQDHNLESSFPLMSIHWFRLIDSGIACACDLESNRDIAGKTFVGLKNMNKGKKRKNKKRKKKRK